MSLTIFNLTSNVSNESIQERMTFERTPEELDYMNDYISTKENLIDFVIINDVEYLFEEYGSYYELINDIRDNCRYVSPNTENYVKNVYDTYYRFQNF